MKTILVFSFFLPFFLSAQDPMVALVKVDGTLFETVHAEKKGLSDVDILISNIGQRKTDERGEFKFSYPIFESTVSDPKVQIQITSGKYKMIHPIDGSISLDTSNIVLFIELIVMGAEVSPKFQKLVEDQKQRIKKLQKSEKLNLRQLNALNKQMIDTIAFYENQQLDFQQKLNELEQELANSKSENTALKEEVARYKIQITALQDSVQSLSQQLFIALEERYLRQQKQFEEISTNLQEYLLRLKDVNDMLPKIKQYFPSGGNPGYAATFNDAITKYNEIYLTIYKEHPQYLEGVNHYWTSEKVSEPTEEAFNFIIKEVHEANFLLSLTEITDLIRQNKAGKAQKSGIASHNKLQPIIQELELKLNKVIALLQSQI